MASDDQETPAKPINRSPPTYPAACEPASDEGALPESVDVMYDVTADGRTENIRVRETTDACFNDAAVAAVRTWTFEPRRVNGARHSQTDLETRLTFLLTEETQTQDFDARPLKRVPPAYPMSCMYKADDVETIIVSFDVNKRGGTENITVTDSSNRCLNHAAAKAVSKWRYIPKLIDGEPVRRNGVETVITFQLSSSFDKKWHIRSHIKRQLNKALREIRKGENLEQVAERLRIIQENYSSSFSKAEASQFYYVRAVLRIELQDYRGALDDLKRTQRSGVTNPEASKIIAETIAKLEYAIADEGAERKAQE